MDNIEYQKIIKKHMPRINKFKKALYAFLCGGIIGLIAESCFMIIKILFHFKDNTIYLIISMGIVLLTSLLTGLGVFDNLVSFLEGGLILPTTGFAHSVISGAMDRKNEGFVMGIAPGLFKLCGAVIISGVVTSFVFSLIGWLIYG